MTRKRSRDGRGGSYAGNHAGVPILPKPFRDKAIPVRATAPCPACKAPVGEPCLRADGVPAKAYHPARRRAAISILRERGEL